MPQGRPVTIQDVARAANVSPATVSRVLNGRSTVDADMAERVRRAAAEAHYVPNSNGRALRRQVSDVWAAIVSDVQNPFFTGMVASLESVAAQRGLSVMLCNTDEQVNREQVYVRTAIAQRMAGVVLAAASAKQSDPTPLVAAGIPVVVVDRRIDGYIGDSVFVDNRLAGRQAADHLLRMGYQHIACIAGPADVSTTEDRLTGFREALARGGHPLGPALVRRTNLRPEGGEVAMRALLASERCPDAVFATNGPVTVGVYRAIQAVGLSMPRDVALVGVDDDQWTRMVVPGVTVVQQPMTEMGALAAELLLSRGSASHSAPQHIVLDPQLLIRATSAPRA
ncbi:MAG: LacI family transcriptional regulator [Micrococcales bacterium]|nr:LacI family transcriptional regulator [Micrococcales bacterium]